MFSLKQIVYKAFFFVFRNTILAPAVMNMGQDQDDRPSSSPPLLTYYDENITSDEMGSHHDSQSQRPSLLEAVEEIKELYTIALPMMMAGLLGYGKSAISTHFLGKLGKDALAGGSLAIGAANITGYSVLYGLATCMDGICSQACGAQQWPLMGQTLQRTILILLLTSFPISMLWLYSQPLLLLFHQEPSISSIASLYLAFSLPDLFLHCFINPLKIYLRAQNLTSPLMLSAILALLFHYPINYLNLYYFSFGIQGLALCGAFTNLILLLVLLIYIWVSGSCSKSWQGWSYRCFTQWWPILHQAIPSCGSVCLEWWWYEIIILISGILPKSTEKLATTGIIIRATALSYNFPFALSSAISTRVGNELGANRPRKAKTSSLVALLCGTVTGFVAMIFMVVMRTAWGRLFTQDQTILSLLEIALPIVGFCEIGNYPQTTLCGVMRGSARPTLGARINFVAFYVVGLPVAIGACFLLQLGFVGLWWGLLAAQVVSAIAMVVMLLRTDWEAQAERARELTTLFC